MFSLRGSSERRYLRGEQRHVGQAGHLFTSGPRRRPPRPLPGNAHGYLWHRHRRKEPGDAAPTRMIQGSKTQLNWPTALAFDPERSELYVANDPADSVLVFKADASGDVAPIRVLHGPKTLIKNPTGVNLDLKNDELWVANFGNHTATVYNRGANGDTPPLRVIQS